MTLTLLLGDLLFHMGASSAANLRQISSISNAQSSCAGLSVCAKQSVQLNQRQLEGSWPHLLVLPAISQGPDIVQDQSQTDTGHCETPQQERHEHCLGCLRLDSVL